MDFKQNKLPILFLIGAALLISFGAYNLYKSSAIPKNAFPDFTLSYHLNSGDGPVSMEDMQGKVGLYFFGYTHCPDICPATLDRVAAILDLLTEEERKNVRPIFISLDPARDTPELVKKYVAHFHPDIIGLAGDEKAVAEATEAFQVGFQKNEVDERGRYTMNHSTYLFVVRPDGELGDLISHSEKPKKVAAAIRYWLQWT